MSAPDMIFPEFPVHPEIILPGRPEMILFDYGGTLMYETVFDPKSGNGALFRFIKDNPRGVSLDEFTGYLVALFNEIRALRGELIEIHEHHFLKYVFEYFDITLSVPIEIAEIEIADAITDAKPAPGADEMLSFLREKGIRTGIISNLCWSGNVLKRRIYKSFPGHAFDFIMTSSDYIFRKPDRHIFELAVRKSGLPADKIWYCGNNIKIDIFGAHESGLFPVFYDDKTVPHIENLCQDESIIDFPYLHLSSWDDLTKAIKQEVI